MYGYFLELHNAYWHNCTYSPKVWEESRVILLMHFCVWCYHVNLCDSTCIARKDNFLLCNWLIYFLWAKVMDQWLLTSSTWVFWKSTIWQDYWPISYQYRWTSFCAFDTFDWQKTFHLTLMMTSAQVAKNYVSCSHQQQSFSDFNHHPDKHTMWHVLEFLG